MGNAISKCREQKAECSAHFISKHFIYFTYSNNNVVRHRMLHFLYDLGLQLEGHYDENGNMCRVLCAKFMIHARLERAYCNFTKYPKTSNAKTKRSKQIEMVLTDGTNKRTNQPITLEMCHSVDIQQQQQQRQQNKDQCYYFGCRCRCRRHN